MMKPLAGIRIVVTRRAEQSAELAEPLRTAGATVHVCPLIRIERTVDDAQAERVLARMADYAWIVFTSSNGVEQFVQLLQTAHKGPADLQHSRIACVGPATAQTAEAQGFSVTVVPRKYLGAGVAASLAQAAPLDGASILLARAGGGGAELPDGLRAAGAVVEDLELYRSRADAQGADRLRALLASSDVDVITFTAGSAATYFAEQVGNPANTLVAVIGPSTARVARRLGMRVDIEAATHTTAGMVQAITEYYAARGGNRRSDAGK